MDLYWPAGVQKVLTVNGNTYISNAQGLFANVLSSDVTAMVSAGCVSKPPETTNQPVSKYSSPQDGQRVTMYGPQSTTLTANGNPYTSTAYGAFLSVLASDVSAMEALGATTEPPYMTQQYNTKFGNG